MAKWNAPEEIEKSVDPVSLDNDKLEFYHDQMHIFWKKIEEGFWFASEGEGWTFKEVYNMHKAVVIEMLKRKLEHIIPINNLDKVDFVKDVKELTKILNYVKEK